MSSLPAPSPEPSVQSRGVARKVRTTHDSIVVIVVVPTLDVGAAGAGAQRRREDREPRRADHDFEHFVG